VGAFEEADFNILLLCQNIGQYYAEMGNLDRALFFYIKYSQLSKQLLDTEPNNSDFKNGLAISYSKLGSFYHYKKPDLTKARYYYEACEKLFSELATMFSMYIEFKNNLAWVEGRLRDL
jgi:tetratricopeptide (TPR) repeat protein